MTIANAILDLTADPASEFYTLVNFDGMSAIFNAPIAERIADALSEYDLEVVNSNEIRWTFWEQSGYQTS